MRDVINYLGDRLTDERCGPSISHEFDDTRPRLERAVAKVWQDALSRSHVCVGDHEPEPRHEHARWLDERKPKVRTNHHRNKEEAARLQALIDKRYGDDT